MDELLSYTKLLIIQFQDPASLMWKLFIDETTYFSLVRRPLY